MFSIITIHVMTSRVQYIRHRLKHMCSVYFSVNNDREQVERTFAVSAGALAQLEKTLERAKTCVRAS